MLVRLVGLKDALAHRDALELLRDETTRMIGIDGLMLELLERDDLKRALHSPEKLIIAGRVLEEMADIHRADGEEFRAATLDSRALFLYSSVLEHDPDALDYEVMDRARKIAGSLPVDSLPWEEQAALVRQFAILGLFDRAEDVLFALLDAEIDHDRVTSIGREFYDRLDQRTDRELEAGGLPRTEVEDGKRTFERAVNSRS